MRAAIFAAYAAGLAIIQLPIVRALYDFSRQDETASHLILIPFVSIVLAYRDRQSIFADVRFSWVAGLSLVAAGAGILEMANGAVANSPDRLTIAIAALVVLWCGGFVACFGWPSARAALFPLLFLVAMIPIPTAVLEGAVSVLRTASTDATSALFALTGTPYHQEGFVFTLPTVVIEVAEECSGIRSSIALVITALVAGHMFLDRGWKMAALVAVALPLAVLKNGIRIVTLTLLAMHVDPEYLTGQLHHEGGVVFFGLSLLMLAPLVALLRRGQRPLEKAA
jgi:exosortase